VRGSESLRVEACVYTLSREVAGLGAIYYNAKCTYSMHL
jgi:hypothetical protein